jgi:hypothetical protein
MGRPGVPGCCGAGLAPLLMVGRDGAGGGGGEGNCSSNVTEAGAEDPAMSVGVSAVSGAANNSGLITKVRTREKYGLKLFMRPSSFI